jgi:deazaflavin-dependent oxidoreductase (nitroreductase family)
MVDITTNGRRSGEARRIEIWLVHVDGRFFITGTPGPRDWLANLRAEPRLVLHLNHGVHAHLEANAVEVTDPALRRHVLSHPATAWYRGQVALEELVRGAPMVELTFAARQPSTPTVRA